jgi:murein hydrolase activator
MKRLAFLLLALCVMSLPAHAATRVQTKEDLAKIQAELEEKKQEQKLLRRSAIKTESELKQLRQKLVRAARDQKASEERLTQLQNRLDELQKTEDLQKNALGEQQTKLSSVLAAMMRLSRLPPEALLMRLDAPIDSVRSALLLRRAMPYYAEKAANLSTTIEKLRVTREDILDKRAALLDAQKQFADREEDLNELLNERQAWLDATEAQRGDIRKEIDILSAEAKNIQELITRVTAPAAIKLPGKKPKVGALAFITPVKGRTAYGFGDKDDVGSSSSGLMMDTKPGDMVVAPADGQVVFAGPFKGYGNILILRHNDDYHSFLAGFGRVDAAVGQVVNAGEPLGRVSSDKGAQAQIYFELRYRGAPVDPMRRISSAVATSDSNSSNP